MRLTIEFAFDFILIAKNLYCLAPIRSKQIKAKPGSGGVILKGDPLLMSSGDDDSGRLYGGNASLGLRKVF